MPRRATVVTYSRRHQLRQVHADRDDWGTVFGKEEKEHIFGSSFSSGHDSSTKLSDSSGDNSKLTRNGKKPKKSDKSNDENKENDTDRPATLRNRKKKSGLYVISDGTSNTSSELDYSLHKTRPLRERNINTTALKTAKDKKPTNKKKTRKKQKEDVNESGEYKSTGLFDISNTTAPKDALYERHFSEFDEFSLCIEVEEKTEDQEVVVNVPPNLTPSTCSTHNGGSSIWPVQHSTPNIHTSTPQSGREPREDLFRRLTRSNLKKMAASESIISVDQNHSKVETPRKTSLAHQVFSPACSYISQRDSMDSDIGDLNTSRDIGSNISNAHSFMVTTRRRKAQSSSRMFSVSSIFSPALVSPGPFCTIPERSESGGSICEMSVVMDPICEQAELQNSMSEQLNTSNIADISQQDISMADCSRQLEEFHISCSEPQSPKLMDITEEELSIAGENELPKSLSLPLQYSLTKNNHSHPHIPVNLGESIIEIDCEDHIESEDSSDDSDIIETKEQDSVFTDSLGDKQTAVQECEVHLDRLSNSLISQYSKSSSVESDRHTPIQACEVHLERISNSLISRYTHITTSSEYDASKSLFGDDTQYDLESQGCKSTDYETAEDKSPLLNNYKNQYCASSDGEVDDNEEYMSARDVVLRRLTLLSCIDELDESIRSLKVLTPVKSRSSGYVLPPRSKVLMLCDQEEPISFNKCISPSMMKKCVKIGEGVYGEVFRSENKKNSVALKIIPIEGDFTVNDEPQKTFGEILTEIVISQTLSDLCDGDSHLTPNFVQVHSCSVVEGRYPDALIKQWDDFHRRKVSENDRPDMFPDDQLFIVFEFADSGCDLEGFKFQSLQEAKSVLVQVALSLAVAESALEFEHRDLHWGNVLVKRTTEKTLDYVLNNEEIELPTNGVRVAIIDFTLSRLRKDGCTVATDLSGDPTLFEGQGDYQFDVYRAMKEENDNNWKPFHPYTNVLWLHYLADKLLRGKTFPKTSTKAHQALCRQFRTFLREALDYQSAIHLVTDCSFFTEEFIND